MAGFTGKKKLIYDNGLVYEGDWVDGEWHGKGKLSFATGNVYEGDFVDGDSHGKGKMIYADGAVYEGDWVNHHFQGKGKLIFTTGDVYVGDFVDDDFHGRGKMTCADGRVLDGNWENGEFVGASGSLKADKNVIMVIDDVTFQESGAIFAKGKNISVAVKRDEEVLLVGNNINTKVIIDHLVVIHKKDGPVIVSEAKVGDDVRLRLKGIEKDKIEKGYLLKKV